MYNTNKQLRFKKPMLQSDLCDYCDAYIVVKGTITVKEAKDRDKHNRNLVLLHLFLAFQKLIIHLLIMQKI